MSKEKYVYWDLETTGRNDKFNQITQVGAVLVNDKFEVLDKLEIRCKLREGKWFEPGALITTGIDPLSLANNNYPNYYEASNQLYETFQNWASSSTTFIGFNSIAFDEPFLRQCFYQNLLPEIYMTVTNNNFRMDVFDIVRMVSVFQPNVIRSEKDENNNPILKLESLAKVNNIKISYDAGPHDAVYDALITLELSKIIATRSSKIWEKAKLFKTRDFPKQFILDNSVFTNCTWWGRRPTIKAQTFVAGIPKMNHHFLVYNLLQDPKKLIELDDDKLKKKLFETSNRAVEVFDASKSKILLEESFCFKNNDYAEIGIEEIRKRAKFIRENDKFSTKILDLYLSNSKSWPESFNIEERIFENFPSNQDKKLMMEFHMSPNDKKYEVAQKFNDDRYKEIAIRILYEINPNSLPENVKRNYEFEITERFHDDDKAKWNSKNKILASLDKDAESMILNVEDQKVFIQKVKNFLNLESLKWKN